MYVNISKQLSFYKKSTKHSHSDMYEIKITKIGIKALIVMKGLFCFSSECMTILRFVNKQKRSFLRFRIFRKSMILRPTYVSQSFKVHDFLFPLRKSIMFMPI